MEKYISPEKQNSNPNSIISFEVDSIDIDQLRVFLKEHPELKNESYKDQMLRFAESFFIKHLDKPEEEDLDALHAFINLNVCSLDELKKDPKIIDALLQALKDLKKENNRNIISRIRNLEIIPEEKLQDAA